MNFDYCEEYSRSISNKILLWYYGSVRKRIFSFSWHLQIDKKSIMQKKIKEKN